MINTRGLKSYDTLHSGVTLKCESEPPSWCRPCITRTLGHFRRGSRQRPRCTCYLSWAHLFLCACLSVCSASGSLQFLSAKIPPLRTSHNTYVITMHDLENKVVVLWHKSHTTRTNNASHFRSTKVTRTPVFNIYTHVYDIQRCHTTRHTWIIVLPSRGAAGRV